MNNLAIGDHVKSLPGDPRTRRKTEGHFVSSAGRSCRWKITARDVPPRQYAAGSDRCAVEAPFHDGQTHRKRPERGARASCRYG